MKHHIARIICFAMLLLVVAAAAPAQQWQPHCTMAGRAGDYGVTWSGTMFLPTGPITAAAVGRLSFDDSGNVSGSQTVSKAGTIVHLTFNGTYTVNADCTGTISLSVFDQSGNLSSKVTWATLSVDNMTEANAIMTSHVTANGVNVPVAITSSSKKLFSRDWRNALGGLVW